jgi:hypothetical protein
MRLRTCAAAVLATLLIPFQSVAQSTTANISGTVKDSTRAVIPGTAITATNVLTCFARTTNTDHSGAYLLTNLPIGEYSVTAEKEGFRRFTQTGITLAVEQNARVDVTMSVGSITETVSVTAQVPDVASGRPVYVTTGRDASLTGVGFDRPNLVGNPERSHTDRNDVNQAFFNTAAFVENAPGKYGTSGRNLFSGPAASSTNLALTKSFRISERLEAVQFRSEVFNAFNQVNFGAPEARLNNRNFGRIQSAGDPRITQFALRYQF